jgi:hypothetical protein
MRYLWVFSLQPFPRRFYKRRADVVFAIYIAVVHTWSFPPRTIAIISMPRTDREKGSEEGRGRGNE